MKSHRVSDLALWQVETPNPNPPADAKGEIGDLYPPFIEYLLFASQALCQTLNKLFTFSLNLHNKSREGRLKIFRSVVLGVNPISDLDKNLKYA